MLELIPALSPEFQSPKHMADWCNIFERAAAGEAVRAGVADPIRHYKSQTTMHGVIRVLLVDPTTRILYFTHSHQKAVSVGKRIRDLARAAGVGPARGHDLIEDWANDRGGGVVVMSADQSKLGYDCHVLIYDDPLDENGWDNAQVREKVDWSISHYQARCMRRGKPGPVMGIMSRGSRDDPFGRRLTRAASGGTPFEYVHRAAVRVRCDMCGFSDTFRGSCDEMRGGASGVCSCGCSLEMFAYAPEVWGLIALCEVRRELAEKDPTERIWWAQFQGEPITTGGDLFRGATRYTELPTWAYRVAHGTDFAFSQGKHADFFALVSGRLYGPKMYILEVRRERIETNLIESTIKAAKAKYGNAPVFSYQSGPEIGTTRILNERGCGIVPMPARYSKLVRAERTIRRWNDGNVPIPEDGAALWVPGFSSRVAQFTGKEDDDGDDEVDAMVSMCDGVMGGGVGAPVVFGKGRV